MRARPSFIAAACIALVLLAGCDSYSLLDKYSIAEAPEPEPDPAPATPTELTLSISSTTLQQGESTQLTPRGGTAPYEWAIVEGDLFYSDSTNKLGTVNENMYKAGNSIGTITIQLWDNDDNMKETVITIIPPTPSGFTVTKAGTSTLDIDWDDANNAYISSFRLFRSISGAAFTETPVLGKTSLPVKQTGLSNSYTYTYYVVAIAVLPDGTTYRSLPTAQASNTPD